MSWFCDSVKDFWSEIGFYPPVCNYCLTAVGRRHEPGPETKTKALSLKAQQTAASVPFAVSSPAW